MTLNEAISKAIIERDPQAAGRIVDLLRFKHDMNYESCYAMFRKNAPDPANYTTADHDELMVESEAE